MARKPFNETIDCPYYRWIVYQVGDTYYADGRSKSLNGVNLGRYSLGCKEKSEVSSLLVRLDAKIAQRRGHHVCEATHTSSKRLKIEEGVALYMDSINKPLVMDGAVKSTQKRYRSVFSKFTLFIQKQGVAYWDDVLVSVVEKYAKWLSEHKSHATVYLEITLIKQIVKWLIEMKHLPESARINIKLRKPSHSTRYCFSKQQVTSILDFCLRKHLRWLHHLVLGLVYGGLRIRELIALRWSNIDFENRMIRLIDESQKITAQPDRPQLLLKNHRSRELPLHPELLRILVELQASAKSDYVFVNSKGKVIHDGSARRTFCALLSKIAQEHSGKEWCNDIEKGRFHSFRHYFVTACADANVPIKMLMSWVGHHHSSMIDRYYHRNNDEAKKQMSNVKFVA